MNDLIETKEDRLFLSLLVAKRHNKELLTEIGVLQSEKDELKHEISQLKEKIKTQDKFKATAEKMSKHDLYYKGVKETLSQLISKVTTGTKIEVSDLKELIDDSFRKWSPIKSKNDLQKQTSLLNNQNKP